MASSYFTDINTEALTACKIVAASVLVSPFHTALSVLFCVIRSMCIFPSVVLPLSSLDISDSSHVHEDGHFIGMLLISFIMHYLLLIFEYHTLSTVVSITSIASRSCKFFSVNIYCGSSGVFTHCRCYCIKHRRIYSRC